MYFLSELEFIGHAFDVKQEQQQHTALSQATSLNVTLTKQFSENAVPFWDCSSTNVIILSCVMSAGLIGIPWNHCEILMWLSSKGFAASHCVLCLCQLGFIVWLEGHFIQTDGVFTVVC